MSATIEKLREVTRGTPYEQKLYLVGGVPRDKFSGLPLSDDVDIVLEGDAVIRAVNRRDCRSPSATKRSPSRSAEGDSSANCAR